MPLWLVTVENNEIKSIENDTVKRHNKQEIHEAAAGITEHTALQQTFFIK